MPKDIACPTAIVKHFTELRMAVGNADTACGDTGLGWPVISNDGPMPGDRRVPVRRWCSGAPDDAFLKLNASCVEASRGGWGIMWLRRDPGPFRVRPPQRRHSDGP